MDYILTQRALTVFHDNKVLTVHAEDDRFRDAIALVSADNPSGLTDLLKPIEAVREYLSTSGRVEIIGNQVMFDGEPCNNYMGMRILEHFREGNPVEPIVNFMINVSANPSKRAVDELLQFLEYGELPITPDGCFLSYKKVGNAPDDYLDSWSRTMDNSVGATCEMPRNAVQDDPNITCSYGLHFCSVEYARSFHGAHLMVLKINPADVVSIPKDYNNTKGRCCKYVVVGELEEAPTESNAWGRALVTDYEEEVDYDDEDWSDDGLEFEDDFLNDGEDDGLNDEEDDDDYDPNDSSTWVRIF